MKEFSYILQLVADGYYEITKQAKMKDAVEGGVEKLAQVSRKIPAIVFVLMAPTFSYLIGTAFLIYSICRYFIASTPDVAISLCVTGIIMIFLGVAVSFFYQKKLDSITNEGDEKNAVIDLGLTAKSKPLNDLLTQFSKEQNEILSHITTKFR